MQTYSKSIISFFLLTTTFLFSQANTESIQPPSIPTISVPTVAVPTAPSLQLSSPMSNATIKTTNTTTSDNTAADSQTMPTELSSELTANALETLSGLFSNDEASLSTLSGLGDFSSLGDLSTLLNEELSTTDDTTTKALLQEILLKLTELEAKIDNLEKKN